MIPIDQLLNSIRWDKHFGAGYFEIGYYDRYEDTLQRVALKEMSFPENGQHRVFELIDQSGTVRRIPFHRIREVYREGRIVWRRESPVGLMR